MKINFFTLLMLLYGEVFTKCNYDRTKMIFYSGSLSDVSVTENQAKKTVKIMNSTGRGVSMSLLPKSSDSPTSNQTCDFEQLHMTDRSSHIGLGNYLKLSDATTDSNIQSLAQLNPQEPQKYQARRYSNTTGRELAIALSNPLKETNEGYFDKVSLRTYSNLGVVEIEQNQTSLLSYQADQFKTGINLLYIVFNDKGEFVEIDISNLEDALEEENELTSSKASKGLYVFFGVLIGGVFCVCLSLFAYEAVKTKYNIKIQKKDEQDDEPKPLNLIEPIENQVESKPLNQVELGLSLEIGAVNHEDNNVGIQQPDDPLAATAFNANSQQTLKSKTQKGQCDEDEQ